MLTQMVGKIAVLVILIVILCVGWFVYSSSHQQIDREILQKDLQNLESYADEGSLLCEQAQAQKVSTTYTIVHARELADKVTSITHELSSGKKDRHIADAVKATASAGNGIVQVLAAVQKDSNDASFIRMQRAKMAILTAIIHHLREETS